MRTIQELAVFAFALISIFAAYSRRWDKATFFLIWAAIIEYGGKW